jgi:hypothetical protein
VSVLLAQEGQRLVFFVCGRPDHDCKRSRGFRLLSHRLCDHGKHENSDEDPYNDESKNLPPEEPPPLERDPEPQPPRLRLLV